MASRIVVVAVFPLLAFAGCLANAALPFKDLAPAPGAIRLKHSVGAA